MKSFTYYLPILLLIFSCSNIKYEDHINKLKKENDSLINVINEYNKKYTYDNVLAEIVKTNCDSNEIGKDYKGQFSFVSIDSNLEIMFGTKRDDSKWHGIKNPVKLKMIRPGVYEYNFKILKDTTDLIFKPAYKNSDIVKGKNKRWIGTKIMYKYFTK